MFTRPTTPFEIRGHDDNNLGSGHFGASRDGGARVHEGIDLASFPGNPIRSPISGTVTHVGTAYAFDDRYSSIHIKNDRYLVKILYCDPIIAENKEVIAGQLIGYTQNLQQKYNGITNHIHLEVYENGILIDPTNLFNQRNISPPVSSVQVNDSIQPERSNTFSYIHTGAPITVKQSLSLDFMDGVSISETELLNIKKQGKTNHRRLYDALPIEIRGDYSSKKPYPIYDGAEIFVPINKMTISHSYESNITSEKTKYSEYFPQIIRLLTNSPSYQRETEEGTTKVSHPRMSVWVWSRVKSLEADSDGWLDISKDVIRCSFESSISQGGSFNIEMPPKNTVFEEGVWVDNGMLGNISQDFYYERILSESDLILIAFEKLKGDSDRPVPGGKHYDAICMVDTVTRSSTFEPNDASIMIRGRDLTKILTDDNSYFNPYSVGHVNGLFGGKIGDRFLDGQFKVLSAFLARSIKDTVEFITTRITSIPFVPNGIFQSFSNKTNVIRTTTQTEDRGFAAEQDEIANGIWQLCKVFVDDSIADLRLVDDAVSNPNGSILDLFNKVAQRPFVEYFSDTYGDKFYMIFRKPPFTKQALSSVCMEVEGDVVEDVEFELKEEEARYKSKLSSEDSGIIIKERKGVSPLENSKIVTIESHEVEYNDTKLSNESYAWYKLNDRGNFLGETVTLGHIPSIYFPEIADIFGNKIFEVTSNYSNYRFFEHSGTESDLDLFAEQSSQHLAYLVETHIYLPFTTSGVIVMTGNRHIKKGNWIYNKSSDEVFYVDSVQNDFFEQNNIINRTTTVQVSRGMVKKHISKYFELVNIDRFKDGVYDIISKGSANDKFDFKSKMRINPEILEFFLKKQQFS